MVTMGFLSDIVESIGRFLFPRQFREDLPEETKDEYRRKIVKTLYYCSGATAHRDQKRSVYALTFESNSIDREQELIDEIESDLRFKHCFKQRDFGYEDFQRVRDPPHTYPFIEVGKE